MIQRFDRRLFLGLTGAGIVTGALAFAGATSAAAQSFAVRRSPADWRKRLGEARYNILREGGTERPFSSPLNNEKRKGVYVCAGCALPLFLSSTKFDSGTGWPSFWAARDNTVVYRKDTTLGMSRTEEVCRRCGGHLGHVFDDGPKPTGKRHCINGLALRFIPA